MRQRRLRVTHKMSKARIVQWLRDYGFVVALRNALRSAANPSAAKQLYSMVRTEHANLVLSNYTAGATDTTYDNPAYILNRCITLEAHQERCYMLLDSGLVAVAGDVRTENIMLHVTPLNAAFRGAWQRVIAMSAYNGFVLCVNDVGDVVALDCFPRVIRNAELTMYFQQHLRVSERFIDVYAGKNVWAALTDMGNLMVFSTMHRMMTETDADAVHIMLENVVSFTCTFDAVVCIHTDGVVSAHSSVSGRRSDRRSRASHTAWRVRSHRLSASYAFQPLGFDGRGVFRVTNESYVDENSNANTKMFGYPVLLHNAGSDVSVDFFYYDKHSVSAVTDRGEVFFTNVAPLTHISQTFRVKGPVLYANNALIPKNYKATSYAYTGFFLDERFFPEKITDIDWTFLVAGLAYVYVLGAKKMVLSTLDTSHSQYISTSRVERVASMGNNVIADGEFTTMFLTQGLTDAKLLKANDVWDVVLMVPDKFLLMRRDGRVDLAEFERFHVTERPLVHVKKIDTHRHRIIGFVGHLDPIAYFLAEDGHVLGVKTDNLDVTHRVVDVHVAKAALLGTDMLILTEDGRLFVYNMETREMSPFTIDDPMRVYVDFAKIEDNLIVAITDGGNVHFSDPLHHYAVTYELSQYTQQQAIRVRFSRGLVLEFQGGAVVKFEDLAMWL